MLDTLKEVCNSLEDWCRSHDISYDLVCDEQDLQGFLIFKKNPKIIEALLDHLDPIIKNDGIHIETRKTRNGVIIAFSLMAIAELHLKRIEEGLQMSFIDKLHTIFDSTLGNLNESAYHTMKNQKRSIKQPTIAAQEPVSKKPTGSNKGATKGATKGAAKGANLRYEERISQALKLKHEQQSPNKFQNALAEALDGLATPIDSQPNSIFKMFAQALRVLGQRMGLGPLQDKLREQGISWKQSDDGQAIILTIKNAITKADQPIARISYETLQNPSDFEVQLKNMLDFATGDAPGAFEQKEQEIQDRKKAISDIAKAIQPQQNQNNDIAQQMGVAQNVAQTVATPKPQNQVAPPL